MLRCLCPALFSLSILGFVACSPQAGSQTLGELPLPGGGPWGGWSGFVHCPAESWAAGFATRTEGNQGGGDDTGLNAVRLICRNALGQYTGTIVPHGGHWGGWSADQYVGESSGEFLVGAELRVEGGQGRGDDTAANNVRFLTNRGVTLSGNGTNWGSWRGTRTCPAGEAVSGLKVKVENPQGNGDDTALNDIVFFCTSYQAVYDRMAAERRAAEEAAARQREAEERERARVLRLSELKAVAATERGWLLPFLKTTRTLQGTYYKLTSNEAGLACAIQKAAQNPLEADATETLGRIFQDLYTHSYTERSYDCAAVVAIANVQCSDGSAACEAAHQYQENVATLQAKGVQYGQLAQEAQALSSRDTAGLFVDLSQIVGTFETR